jgi:23S rRNA (cytidine1920-2'-O)/16S rRNA (cytidine1409-2'-O)-methyltransferase
MDKMRLDQAVVKRGLTSTRSQAESYIKLGYVKVNAKTINKPGFLTGPESKIELNIEEQYVSRAALKLASVADKLKLSFKDKVILDVGSSTGGFTDYALKHGASKVIAVEVGTEQMHPTLRSHPRIELHEKTDVRSLRLRSGEVRVESEEKTLILLDAPPDIVLVDVSFISLREILPHISKLLTLNSLLVVMLKPQFEVLRQAQDKHDKYRHKGVIKNGTLRRKILKDFESWAKSSFRILDKADSEVAGSKGNLERFYLLKIL